MTTALPPLPGFISLPHNFPRYSLHLRPKNFPSHFLTLAVVSRALSPPVSILLTHFPSHSVPFVPTFLIFSPSEKVTGSDGISRDAVRVDGDRRRPITAFTSGSIIHEITSRNVIRSENLFASRNSECIPLPLVRYSF